MRILLLFCCLSSSLLCAESYRKADSLFWQGESQKSFSAYEKLIHKNPTNITLLRNASCVASDLTLLKKQHDFLLELCAQEPESLWGWRNLGWYSLNTGDEDKAVDYFNTALQLDSTDYASLTGMGLYYHARGQLAEAQAYYDLLIKEYPEKAPGYYLLGDVYHSFGNHLEAEKYLQKSIKKDYAMPESRMLLARVYVDSAQTDKGWSVVSKVLNIDPLNKEAKKLKNLGMFDSLKTALRDMKPIKKLIKHMEVFAFSEPGKIPYINVGLTTDGKGKPRKLKKLRCNFKGTITLDLGSSKEMKISSSQYAEWEVRLSTKAHTIELINELQTVTVSTTNYIIIKPATKKDTIIIRNIPYATGYAWAGRTDREYRGSFIIRRNHDRLIIINRVLFEEYLFSVLPSEMISYWPKEALKAQAVIARGYSWHKKKYPPHEKYGYNVCSGQHCQVYAGVGNETSRTTDAVYTTKGEVLKYKNRIANTLYSSNCGGHTQSSKDLKNWGNEPFLKGVADMEDPAAYPKTPFELFEWIHNQNPPCFCASSKHTYSAEARWMRVVPADYVTERINRRYKIGSVKDIAVLQRSPSGHIRKLKVIGKRKTVYVEKENRIRGIFAPGGLRSTYYTVDVVRVGAKPLFFVFRGGGWGHAVGMCQSGAAGMAERGKSYAEILKHYYYGTRMKKLDW